MRRLSLALVAAAAVGSFAPMVQAREATPTAPAPGPSAKDDPNRMICTREHVVGSNRPKKVCLTAAQREEIREQARRNMDEGRRTPGGRDVMPTNTGA